MRSDDEMRRLTHTDETMEQLFARAEQAFVAQDAAAECWQDMQQALSNMRVINGITRRLAGARTSDGPARLKALVYLLDRYRSELSVYEDAFVRWCDAADMRDEYIREMERQGLL